MDQDWKEFLRQKYTEYKKIGHVECPAFNNEEVHFNEIGFRHLTRKERKFREKSEQMRRLALFQFAPGIIKRALIPKTYFNDTNEKGIRLQSWSFEDKVNGMKITVIIEQVNLYPKNFLSIFNEKVP